MNEKKREINGSTKEKNMTALVSCFARAYHYEQNETRIFSDSYAGKLLSSQERQAIAENMSRGIQFFDLGFEGTAEEALRWIVDHQLSPSVLGRSAFCEEELEKARQQGCSQYLIFASGYDTFACRSMCSSLKIFELDRQEMVQDKKRRLEGAAKLDENDEDSTSGRAQRVSDDVCEMAGNKPADIDVKPISAGGIPASGEAIYIPCDLAKDGWDAKLINSGYQKERLSFYGLLGISYYLTGEEFGSLLKTISRIICGGSQICFDYPTIETGDESRKNRQLAEAAQEQMKAKYSYQEMAQLLQANGFALRKHLNDEQMTAQYFTEYNRANPQHQMQAPEGVSYCLAEKC
ncbi:MAG: class I SAM-dependent methyltransferase [Bacillota bacterium]|nr:class I SAM-dependent methyltransferase [Bacillota bacterium]